MLYYELPPLFPGGPRRYIARNYKVLTLSIGKATFDTYYYRPGLTNGWHASVPQTETPDGPVLMLVRDPVERFLSATTMLGHDADVDLSCDVHYTPQVEWITDNTTVYRFPEGLEWFCKDAGLQYPLPIINAATRPKLSLIHAQRQRIVNHYADDAVLFERALRP